MSLPERSHQNPLQTGLSLQSLLSSGYRWAALHLSESCHNLLISESSSAQEYDSPGYKCVCSSGFSGSSCNKQATSPAQAPTAANTTTTPSGTYTCPVACEHGQCVEQFGVYSCACSTGYSGASCSAASTPANAPAPSGTCTWCKHGACKAIANSQNEYYCDCQTGYSDWDCGTVSGVRLIPAARLGMFCADIQAYFQLTFNGTVRYVTVQVHLEVFDVSCILCACFSYHSIHKMELSLTL